MIRVTLAFLLGLTFAELCGAESQWRASKRDEIIRAADQLRGVVAPEGALPPASREPLRNLQRLLLESGLELMNHACKEACFQQELDAALAAEDTLRFRRSASVTRADNFDGVDLVIDLMDDASGFALLQTRIFFAIGHIESFYFLRNGKSGWELALALDGSESDQPVESVRKVYVRPLAESRPRWLFLVVDKFPYSARVRAIGFGSEPAKPSVVFDRELQARKGPLDNFHFRVLPDGFMSSFTGERRLDQDVRHHVVRYREFEGHLLRSNPVALTPHDFVDEWISMPWEEAKEWLAHNAKGELRKLHDRLQNSKFEAEIDFVQPCQQKAPEQWDIGLSIFQNRPRQLPQQLFFIVERAGAGSAFRLVDIAEKRRPGCPGETPWTAFPEVLPPDFHKPPLI